MKAVFGIGNPGKKYENTRHNVGFMVIDRLRERRGEYRGQRAVILVKPRTFVNNSGISAKRVLLKYQVAIDDFLVVVDDFSITLGKIRLRRGGSGGGHKGLESIIHECGTKDFPRLKIGTGPLVGDAVEFVLSPFEKQEIPIIKESIERACDTVETFLMEGIDKAMQICNRD